MRPPPTRVLLCFLAVSLTPALAQTNSPQPTYTLRTRVPITIVDVVVTDAHGRPVHGLKPSDFTVFEDKQEMNPSSFEEHRSDEASASSAPAPLPKPLSPNTFTNATPTPAANHPVNVLLLDSLNTPMGVQTIVRQQMADYIKRMPAGTRMAIFSLTTRLAIVQGFTSDRDLLLAALTRGEKALPQFALLEDWGQDPMQDQDKSFESEGDRMVTRAQTTFSAINQIARYLSGIPGRKNLLWFTGSFPQQYPPEPRDPLIFPPVVVPQIYDLSGEVKAEAETLARAHISVYSMEPRGLNPPVVSRRGDTQLGEHDTMDLIADRTGGRNTFNTNDLTGAAASAIDQGANFYTLTYTPTNQTLDTRFRTISVKVSQPGLHLSYRTGYYAVDPTVDAHGKKIETIPPMQTALLRGSLEPTEITFRVTAQRSKASPTQPTTTATPTLQPVSLPANNQPNPKLLHPPYRIISLSFLIDIHGIDFTPGPDGNLRGAFEYGVRVYNPDGDEIVNAASKEVHPILPPAVFQSMLRGGANAHLDIAMPATGDFFLRVAVHDLTTHHIGALEIPTASLTQTSSPPSP